MTRQKVALEEEFGRLRLVVADDADDVLVSQLRGNYRLFLIAGSEAHVDAVVAGLSKYKALLKEKNVVIATLDMAGDAGDSRRKEDLTESERDPNAGVAALAAEFAAARADEAGGDASPAAPALEFGSGRARPRPARQCEAGPRRRRSASGVWRRRARRRGARGW